MKTGHVKINSIRKDGIRLDALCQLSDGHMAYRMVMNCPCKMLSLQDVTLDIFNAERWKRVYVNDEEHGYRFIGSSSMLQADMNNVKYISRKYTVKSKAKVIKKGMTLVSCSGTIGKTVFANAKHAGTLASQHVIRLLPNNILGSGYIYAYLTTRYGYALLTQGTYGGVIRHIEPVHIKNMPIPVFSDEFVNEVDDLIQSSARLREEAADMLAEAERLLKDATGLPDLTPEDYDYFGPRVYPRKPSCFVVKRKDITTTTINAFNLSERIKHGIIDRLKGCATILFVDAISDMGWVSPPGVEVVELEKGKGIELINQSDIFCEKISGKWVQKKTSYQAHLLKYGEILIAKIGTLGENETFCRSVFVNEDLQNHLVSSAFYRLMPNEHIPSGYLFCWLNSDYGFRLLRSTQYGTKQCYPNPVIFNNFPIPILPDTIMQEIDRIVREAHTKRYQANCKERKAISMVETEIEKWNK